MIIEIKMPRIPIEQKHTYNTIQNTLYGTYRTDNLISDTVFWQLLTYPELGVDENERIGRKIHTDYISYETYYQLQTNYTLANGIGVFYDDFLDEEARYYNNVNDNEEGNPLDPIDAQRNTLQSELDIVFREFWVEFEPDSINVLDVDQTQQFLLDWYQKLVVQTAPEGTASIRQQVKRESTQYTGTFKILRDKLHHINFRKQLIHDFGTFEYKRNLNFADDIYPTQGILIRFWIGPQNALLDYGNLGFGVYLQGGAINDQVAIINVSSTMKLSYSDV